ncbi:hypothetical protein [Fusobacterium perfoetens]|uniref:hypothetical protein n=1 Tax=Fusobacterium perfoetens TaxID=852 RepID=UPI0004861D28|nr:hypothetical protein [Fusobacterium perfoetens]
MLKEKILIVSYYFYEENTPRSHRAFELARELAKKYEVEVVTSKKNVPEIFFEQYGIKIIYLEKGFLLNKNVNSLNNIKKIQREKSLKSKIIKKIKNIYNYLFLDRQIEFSYFVYKYLKNVKDNKKAIISIAFPFSSHLGSYLGIRKNKKLTDNLILEYGDPFYYNKTLNIAYYFKIIEALILKKLKYIVLPIENAKEAFKKYKVENKIKIIPQGFDLSEYKLEEYKRNKVPTFIYAGVFYEKIRNPLNILKLLNTIDKDYKFIIFSDIVTIEKMKSGKSILEEIKKSKGKIEIRPLIPRKECIIEMSKVDFLLNISNVNLEQSPSKLIDYGIAKRPILSFNQNNFNKEIFIEFLNGNYKNQEIIDLEKYDIKTIGKQYKKLIEKEE